MEVNSRSFIDFFKFKPFLMLRCKRVADYHSSHFHFFSYIYKFENSFMMIKFLVTSLAGDTPEDDDARKSINRSSISKHTPVQIISSTKYCGRIVETEVEVRVVEEVEVEECDEEGITVCIESSGMSSFILLPHTSPVSVASCPKILSVFKDSVSTEACSGWDSSAESGKDPRPRPCSSPISPKEHPCRVSHRTSSKPIIIKRTSLQ